MNLNSIVPSRLYSWVFTGIVEMKKGGRAGVPMNPLSGFEVTCRKVYAGQAASGEMYVNAARKLNPDWAPSDRTPTWEPTSNPCVVKSLSTQECQVRILNPRTVKREYFVDGLPATPTQLETIQAYLPTRKSNPLAVRIMFPYVDHLSNVDGELPESDCED